MTQPSYPPPPPPPERERSEFHLPRTNLFSRVRAQLAALERLPQFKSEMEPIMGFLIALVSAAFLGILIALAMNTAILPALGQAAWLGLVIIIPIIEEIAKAACMLAVAYAIPRMFPNRRYGATVGAAAGLGYGVFESIIYIITGKAPGIGALIRLLATPIMHPIWSAFVGIGVFVFLARRPASRGFFEAVFGLPLLFLLIGMIHHAIWNGFVILLRAAGGIWATPYLSYVLAVIIVFPIFAIILRDFLGGHFNFQRFFEPLPELPPYYPKVAPPPPPPPTIPTCPTCQQPLAYIQEHKRWYCSKCRRYIKWLRGKQACERQY